MKVEPSQFCIRLNSLSTYIILLVCFSIQLAKADTGQTFTLKQERSQILTEMRKIQTDSVSSSSAAVLDALQLRVLSLDEKIFTSYDESISRMANKNIRRSSNDKLAVYLALVTTMTALFFSLLLVMARSRVQANGNIGLRAMYKQLAMDLMSKVSAKKVLAQRLLRVNVVVLVGLVMMSISIVAYLLSNL
ncbi:MAG: hypothetical protein ACI9Z7_000037 [Alteromonas macleodii]|jgi:hypothetical protein